MGRKTLLAMVAIVVIGGALLGFEVAVKMGAFNDLMAAPDELVVNGSASPAPNGTVIVVEWHLPRKPLEKLLDGRDLMFLIYPSGIAQGSYLYPFFYGAPVVNLTLYPSGRVMTKNEDGYSVWWYDTEGSELRVEAAWEAYVIPANATGGRVELFVPTVNYSRCSVLPVVVVYFHEMGGDDIEPNRISSRLPVYVGPDFPVSGNDTLQMLFSLDVSKWVKFYLGERGGWAEVRTFNVTLPCEGN